VICRIVVAVEESESMTASLIVFVPGDSYRCAAVFVVVYDVSQVPSFSQSQRTSSDAIASCPSDEHEASTRNGVMVVPADGSLEKHAVGVVLCGRVVSPCSSQPGVMTARTTTIGSQGNIGRNISPSRGMDGSLERSASAPQSTGFAAFARSVG
jgi:hypothetical protein